MTVTAFWLREEFSEAARKAALEARKANHPDWHWGDISTMQPGARIDGPHGVSISRLGGQFQVRQEVPGKGVQKQTFHADPKEAIAKANSHVKWSQAQAETASAGMSRGVANAEHVPEGTRVYHRGRGIYVTRDGSVGRLPVFRTDAGVRFDVHPRLPMYGSEKNVPSRQEEHAADRERGVRQVRPGMTFTDHHSGVQVSRTPHGGYEVRSRGGHVARPASVEGAVKQAHIFARPEYGASEPNYRRGTRAR